MPQTDAAPADAGSDPVLTNALSEMEAEGALGEETGDPQPDEGAAAPPATAPTSDAPATEAPQTDGAPAEEDPYAGTEPFTHDVNGETITLDGVYRVPGEGAVIPEAQIGNLNRLIEERADAVRQNREFVDRNATYDRLTTWQTKDADGKDQTLSGPQAIVAMRQSHARLEAALSVVGDLLSPDANGNPAKLLGLLATAQDGKIVFDQSAVDALKTKIDYMTLRAEQQATQGLQAPAEQQAPDYSKLAPDFIAASAKRQGVEGLTKEDTDMLVRQFAKHIRPATAQDRLKMPGLTVGLPMVDPEFDALVKYTATLRAQNKQQVAAAEKAGKHNAGMDKGRQQGKAAPPSGTKAAPVAPPKPANDRQRPDWDGPLSSALAELGIAR